MQMPVNFLIHTKKKSCYLLSTVPVGFMKKEENLSLSLYYNISTAISGQFRFMIGSTWPFYRDKRFTSYKLHLLFSQSTQHYLLCHHFLGNTSFMGVLGFKKPISGGSTSTPSLCLYTEVILGPPEILRPGACESVGVILGFYKMMFSLFPL